MKRAYPFCIAAMLSLSSCSSAPKYPGFTEILKTPDGAAFYVDVKSIHEEGDGSVDFKLLQTLPVGYAIQDVTISTANQFASAEGMKYREDGSGAGSFQGITVDLNQVPQAGPMAVATFVHSEIAKKKSFDGDYQDAKALQALYGDYRPDINGCLRKNVSMPNDDSTIQEALAHIFLSQNFTMAGDKKHVLLISTKPEEYNCHACAPLVSSAIFRKSESGWALESQCENVDIPGQNGEPAPCSWEQIGKDKWAIVVCSTDGNQGIFNTAITVVELGKVGTKILLSDSVDFTDTTSAPNCKLEFEKTSKAFWDATLKTTFKDEPSKNSVAKYVFIGDAYHKEESVKENGTTGQKSSDYVDEHVNPEIVPPIPTSAPKFHSTEKKANIEPTTKKRRTGVKPAIINSSDPLDPRLFVDH
jgi:hypothetical protein